MTAQQAFPLRQALWESDALRESFIADNPAGLSEADLALVASWHDRIMGRFFIFRHLKHYTVFLNDQQPPRAYGVRGLHDPIADVVPTTPPVLVDAVLLPFEDKIVFDGMMNAFPIHFGGGIRRNLQDSYRAVQERGGVITTLTPPDTEELKERSARGNKKLLTAFQKDLAASGLSLKMVEQHTATIAALGDQLLEQQPPRPLLDIALHDIRDFRGGQKKDPRVSLKRFIRFLMNSDRIDWEAGQEMQDWLKG